MDAFSWVATQDPHIIGETQIKLEWTLDVQSDGSVAPRMPDRLILKDGENMRPVASFIEVWCDVGADGDEANWVRQPLTKSILAAEGLNAANLTFEVTAFNLKVARRTGNANHRYGTFEPVRLRGDEHASVPLRGVSPAVGPGMVPLIPPGRFIPMGRAQVIRTETQPSPNSVPWSDKVNKETIRIRVMPARGEFYGPPGSAQVVQPFSRSRGFSAVIPGNDFLNRDAGWFGARAERGFVSPGDTYDGAELSNADDASLGIIDDTCEVAIRVRLDSTPLGGATLETRANVFCGPPDYAPDRRPFVSLADSLNDRSGNKRQRNQDISDEELDRWVEDLFERAFESVSLMNVDIWRRVRAATLNPDETRPAPIPDDATRDPGQAMSGFDVLRDENIALEAPSDNIPLPLSERAWERHRDLSDIVVLKAFIREKPDRLEALIRPPFSVADNENGGATNMQMPPFMRNSNAQPLTLTEWQYELLMEWQRRVLQGPPTIEKKISAPAPLSDAAEQHRRRVLERIRNLEEPRQ